MKILIADPHREVRSAFHLILRRNPDVTEVSETGSLVQLLSLCAHECPDLILCDRNLVGPARAPIQPLTDLIRVVRKLCPDSRIVIMSSRSEEESEVLSAGADGFVSKINPPDEVISGIARFLEYRS